MVIWEVTATDEAALDRYEGFPTFYYKRGHPAPVQRHPHREAQEAVTAFAYIMHEDQADWRSEQFLHADLPGRVRYLLL